MKSYGEYCPVAMGAEVLGDRWTPLVLRELICGSERFNEIHNGVPRMSRTLLTQRLKQLERIGVIERRTGPTYHLTDAGRDLESVVMGMGEWASVWLVGDPAKEHVDGAHVMWRVRQRIVEDAIPSTRTVVHFELRGAQRGRHIWLILDPTGSSLCQRDEGFDVDVDVTADIHEFMRIWAGRTTWRDAQAAGTLTIEGRRELVRAFPKWFALSPFAGVRP